MVTASGATAVRRKLVVGNWKMNGSHASNAELLALAERVTARHDAELERAFPAHFGGAAEVRLRSGEVLTAQRLDSNGTPVRPLSRAALRAKYDRVTRGLVAPAIAARLADAIEALPHAESLDGLLAALSAAAADFRTPAAH